MWILFFVSLAVATLSGLGVGSAGLLVIFLTAVQHVPQLTAQGLNLVFFLFSSGAALLVHVRRLTLPSLCIFLLIPTGLIGSVAGVALANICPQRLLRQLFGGFLIISGGIGIWRPLRTLLAEKLSKRNKK